MNKKHILLSAIFLFCVSCQNNPEYIFTKMIENPVFEEGEKFSALFSYDLKTGTYNKYQDTLYRMGKSINKYLLKKSNGVLETKYIISNVIVPLTDGDIAIALLLDINEISDDLFLAKLVDSEIREDYRVNGAHVWWKWIHESSLNRQWVISEIEKLL